MINFEILREDYKLENYDPELKCDYHLGQVVHFTDNCWRLRNKIQDLVDMKLVQLDFVDAPRLKVITNPLPDHRLVINMITIEKPKPKINLDELPITIEQVA